ncbi:hypothetical protein ABTM86_19425, partial [Acinetobacter baumannii]
QALGHGTQFGFAFSQGSNVLTAQMAGRRDPAFLVAGPGGVGVESMARAAGSLRQQLGPIGVSAGIENGDVIGRRDPLLAGLQGYRRSGY